MTARVRADARTPFPGSGRAFLGHSISENRTYLKLGAKYAKRPALHPTDSQFLTPSQSQQIAVSAHPNHIRCKATRDLPKSAMTPETEERIGRQLTTFEELVKHLATKEELQKLRAEIILWILGTNIAVGSVVAGAIIWHINQFYFFLQHWKP